MGNNVFGIATILNGSEWADSEARSGYIALRRAKSITIRKALTEAKFDGSLGGSWARDDFHLSRDGVSKSDLDLVLPGAAEVERFGAEQHVTRTLAEAQVPLNVSVHPSQSFASMPLDEQFYFNLLEYLSAVHDTDLDYQTAKAGLMLSRVETRETGIAAGMRRGLGSALRVKVGSDQHLDRESTMGALIGVKVGADPIEEWIREPIGGLTRLSAHFERRRSESCEWIYSHASRKARAAVELVRQRQ